MDLYIYFQKNMFSISAKPLHSIIEPDGKIIILTETQLLFTTLDSFDNFRSINIMSSHPVTCYFAPEVLEVLVLAKNMIEIYYCDWQTNVYPCRVIVLNQAPIYTINYEQTTGWNIYGNREQMETTKVNFHSFPQEKNPQQLFCCFIEESQYILTTSGLFRVVKREKQLIHWPLRQNVLKELKNRITSFQTFNRDHKHIICLEKKFILVIEEDQVTHTIYRDKITYIDNEIFMSKPIQNQRSVEEEKFAKQIGIKQLQNVSDSAIGGRMFGKQLMYIEYKNKKLHLLSHFNSSLIGERKGKRFQPTRRTSQKDSSNKTVSEQSQDFDDLMNEVQSSKSSDELSLKSNDILGRKQSSLHRSKGKGKNNDLLHVSVQSNEVQTPGFVLMGSSDRFGSYNSDFKWVQPDNSNSLRASNQKLNDKVIKSYAKEAEVSFVIQEEESHLQSPSSEVPVLSDKVKMFKPPNKLATSSIIKTIQSKPHILLLSEMERSDERRFKKAVKDSVWEWVKEKQASMFLARFITAEDQSEIKHQINQLFQNGLTEQRKQIITSALKQFKLGDVPSHLLCFSGEFIQILLRFDRNVYIEQLLDPSEKTISRLTISFLQKIKQNPSQSTISLESRQIDLSHQKNILNVLFYLNDSLHLPQRSIILPFVRIMLQEGKLEIIAKIKEQEILKICQVQEKLYEHQIIQFIKQKVEASDYSQKIKEQTKSTEDYLSKLVSLLYSEASSEYYVKIVILNDLIQKEVEFNSKNLLDFNKQMSIKEILVQIIDSNSAGKLKSFKCANIYKGLYWIKQKGKKLEGINTELSEILRILGEKLIARREYFQGFKKIRNNDGMVDSAFLGSLFEKYCEGKMLLRLKGKQRFCNMPEIFPQLMKKKIDPERFVIEGVQPPSESDEFSCNWNKFCWIYEKYLSTSNSLKILTFLDSKMSEKIFQLLQEPILFKYHQFKKQVTYYQPSLKKLSQSEHSYSQSSFVERQDFLLQDGHLASNDKKNTSTYIIPRKTSFNLKGKSLSQGNPDEQSLHSAYHQLNNINNEEQIWKELQNIYNTSSELVFLDAASAVRNKIELYHIDKLEMLVEQNLMIKLQKVLPFTLFKIEQNELALETITFDIRQIVTVENFWVIWNIIELFFGYGDMVSLLLVEKIILWNRDDELFSIVKYLLTGNSWILDEELQNYLEFTEKLQMQKTNRCLKKIIFDLQHQI